MMQHLFRPEGEAALTRTLGRQPLLVFDFDGTLTPIVARPQDAHLSHAVSTRLAGLGAYLPVAILTGRRVDDVRERLGFEPQYIVGNHGAEDPSRPGGPSFNVDAMDKLRGRLQESVDELSAAGVWIEDKIYSLALHYRLSRSREKAVALIHRLLPTDKGLKVFGGKMVVNVLPANAPDKAKSTQELLRRSGKSCVIFAGDDVNDEPVFCSAPSDWLTIRVGRDDARSQAQYFLDSPAEMSMLLERMVVFLRGATPDPSTNSGQKDVG